MEEQKSFFNVKGDVYVTKTDEHGAVEELAFKNLVVTAGKTYIAARMSSNTASVMSHMAIGNSITAAAISDTTLGTELGRVALSVSGGTPSSNTITYSASFPAGTGTGGVTEAGIFNDVTTGTMLCRTVFPIVSKAAGDTLAISWVVSII